MGILGILFIVVPAIELAVLIEIGSAIGAPSAFALIVLTGFVGAGLAKRAGLDVLRRINAETGAGRLPAGALVDGAIILVAGALLVTPGVLTDIFGFACLVPGIRALMKQLVVRYFERAVARGQVQVGGFGAPPHASPRGSTRSGFGPIIDVTPGADIRQPPEGRP